MLLARLSIAALPVIFAVTLHEAAHGFVAYRCGDETAYLRGRVTLNPLRHIDLYGTILLPLFLLVLSQGRFMFGYAKPVPVAYGRLAHPRRDMVLVAAAGPFTNLGLALISALLLRLLAGFAGGFGGPGGIAPAVQWLAANLTVSVLVNAILAVFNMIPLPPLDGGRVAVGLLPEFLAIRLARVERYGMLILVSAIVLLPMIAAQSGLHVDFVATLVDRPVSWIVAALRWVSGYPHV